MAAAAGLSLSLLPKSWGRVLGGWVIRMDVVKQPGPHSVTHILHSLFFFFFFLSLKALYF